MKRTWRRAISCCLVVVMCLTTSLSTVVAAEQASAPRTPSSGGVVPTFPTQQTPDISMSPTGELQGRLLDRNGQPLANRQVTVVRDHLLTAQATTDTDGNFKVVGKE
ncbi:MAG: hypothetical protein KDA99_25415 [Planctomycetales bacterium]|nr:hypothetical protein [Planctomycetales bacterium]